MDTRNELIGSWRLVSFELEAPDGSISHPYGEDLVGYLFYNEQGYMSSAFMSAGRGGAAEGADLAEAARANTYDQFMAYCGGYRIQGDRILHQVEVSSLALWIGTRQERWFKIDGDRLEILTAPLSVDSEAPVGRLVWQRASRAVEPS